MLTASWKFAPAFVLVLAAHASNAAQPETQSIRLEQKVQIPGGTLNPGEYSFSVEDRLRDRAILRIDANDSNKHYLLLTAPNDKLGDAAQNGLIYFHVETGKKQILKGWACPGCSTPFELVYPKPEAAKILAGSADSVLASDPEYDKLPAHLSADDMKVITLWLLTPQRITASHHGAGVSAVKYTAPVLTGAAEAQARPAGGMNQPSVAKAPGVETRQTDAERSAQAAPVLTAQSTPPRMRMPHTATNTFEFALYGLLLILAALASMAARWQNSRGRS